MGQDRTAIDTITGYYYQFDYYILQLLQLKLPTNTVCIEGIEDVDIKNLDETTAVQCKYYSKTEYNHSVIAKPIRLMLSNYNNNPNKKGKIHYILYGNFQSGQNKFPQVLNTDFVKEHFLTYTYRGVKHEHHKELALTDNDIEEFIKHLTVNINAISYDEQEELIIKTLQGLFKCSKFEAEYYYYNNALRLVKQLATEQDIAKRTISKGSFEKAINQKCGLFDCWYLEFKGKKKYCKAVKAQYFSNINISPYERFFLIDCDAKVSETELKSLVLKIAKNWSKLSPKEPKTFCPYIYLHNVSEETIIKVKKEIQDDNVYFLDGYNFKGADFSEKSIIRKATMQNDVKFKFITELEQLNTILQSIETTRIIYQFFIHAPYYVNKQYEHHLIQISETEDIASIV